jgi:opacity protein-like surface antigen
VGVQHSAIQHALRQSEKRGENEMKQTLLAVGCSFLVVGTALAGSFQVGGHGAYTIGGDISKREPGYGVQIAYNFSEAFSLELAISRLHDEASESEDGIKIDEDVDITPATLSARYALPFEMKDLRVYGMAGVGYYMYATSVDVDISELVANENISGLQGTAKMDLDIKDTFGYHIGGGLEWALWKHTQLFAEYRYCFVKPEWQ